MREDLPSSRTGPIPTFGLGAVDITSQGGEGGGDGKFFFFEGENLELSDFMEDSFFCLSASG